MWCVYTKQTAWQRTTFSWLYMNKYGVAQDFCTVCICAPSYRFLFGYMLYDLRSREGSTDFFRVVPGFKSVSPESLKIKNYFDALTLEFFDFWSFFKSFTHHMTCHRRFLVILHLKLYLSICSDTDWLTFLHLYLWNVQLLSEALFITYHVIKPSSA